VQVTDCCISFNVELGFEWLVFVLLILMAKDVDVLDGNGDKRLVDEMNGMVQSILIKQCVIGVDRLIMIIVDCCNNTLIVAAHVNAWFDTNGNWEMCYILL